MPPLLPTLSDLTKQPVGHRALLIWDFGHDQWVERKFHRCWRSGSESPLFSIDSDVDAIGRLRSAPSLTIGSACRFLGNEECFLKLRCRIEEMKAH